MTMKGWVLGRMNRLNARDAHRHDEPANEPREPTVHALYEGRDALARTAQHLGPYAALIGALRDELEHFAASQLALHLAIAERDRFLLTSIDVECEGGGEPRDLMRRFASEFRPEQIKHYVAKELIAGLRNASAIDLTQFAGLNAGGADRDGDDDRYAALIDELSADTPSSARPYKVTLVGRWSEIDAPSAPSASPARDVPQTPLAARALDVAIDDAQGSRRASLAGVMPGRRYVVGKGEACDIVVDGVYASRRHCEIWLERGAWWVADCGSTNGLRIESARGVLARSDASAARRPPLEVPVGASIVLSAHAQGATRDYPRIALRPAEANVVAPGTPVTPIAVPRRRDGATLAVRMASGDRNVDIAPGALPFGVGRSRNQALVVDWAHEDVSGHHFDIVALDAAGATVVVHGDNGVRVGAQSHPPGSRFVWKPGETIELGASGGAGACTLTLAGGS